MCTSGLLSTTTAQPEPKVAHKLIPAIPLKAPLELIDLGEELSVDGELILDLLDTADNRRVVTPVEDARDHGVRVVIKEVADEIHGHVAGVNQRTQPLGAPNVLNGKAVEIRNHRQDGFWL